jgi:hypothetical protein
MNLDSAVGVAQASLQQSAKLPQQGKYGVLVFLKAGDTLRRHARNQDKSWTPRSFETHHRSLAPDHHFQATLHWRLAISTMSTTGSSTDIAARLSDVHPYPVIFERTKKVPR